MDCTFCLDCVHACPHDNVGLIAGLPGKELWRDPFRSGIGRFGRRTDLAALVVILVFGSLANAAGMVGPVVEWQDRLRLLLGRPAPWLVTSLFAGFTLVVLPATAVGGAAAVSRRWGNISASSLEVATRFSYALVPLGFGMWLSHYSFSLPDELGDGPPRGAARRPGSRLDVSGRTAVPVLMLSARR